MGKKRIIKKKGEDTQESEAKISHPSLAASTRRTARGIVYIQATYNNTMITVTDEKGNVIAWSSAGLLRFSGAKKATPYAAARVAEDVFNKARKSGVQEMVIMVSGVGSGRDSAIRAIANQGLPILFIKDITPLPHNGPRAPKVRRV